MVDEITKWIDNPQRDYSEGVRLLQQYGKNCHSVRYFSNRSPRFAMPELVAELQRLNKLAAADRTTVAPATEVSCATVPKKKQPDVVERAKQLVHEYWVKLSQFLRALFEVGEGNSDREIAARLLLLDEREPYIERYTSVYEAKEAYFKGKLTLEQLQEVVDGKTISAVLQPTKPKQKTAMEFFSDLTLAKAIHAAKTAINRYNNQLRYQKESRAKQDNPMPNCPKRRDIEKKLKIKEEELKLLEEEKKKRGL